MMKLLTKTTASALIVVCVACVVACRGGADTSTVNGDGGAGSSGSSGSSSGSSGSSGVTVIDGGSSGGPTDGGGAACTLPSESGPCEAAILRFFFNSSSGKCETFTYGGCGGNANNFASAKDCVTACAPTQPNPCTIIECPEGSACVFKGASPECAAPCADAGGTCPITTMTCQCGASCPNCKDCQKVCLP